MREQSAFTLIEIIFTILLLGIIATGLPMLLISDADNREESIVQEALYASTAKMSQILSFRWDERNNNSGSTITSSKILDLGTSATRDIEFDRIGTNKFRVGHFIETGRRSFYDSNLSQNATLTLNLGSEENSTLFADDIDDFDGIGQAFIAGVSGTSAQGYKRSYSIDISTSYVNIENNYTNQIINGMEFESLSFDPTNMKRTTININDAGTVTRLFSLRSYSSNIGETSISSRIYP